MTIISKIPNVTEEEQTPLIYALVGTIHSQQEQIHSQQEQIQLQQEQIQQLKDEIARLKGLKPKPIIKPSQLEKPTGSDKEKDGKPQSGKRPGSEKRSKTQELIIHETKIIQPEIIPEGSSFKGYEDYVVQELIIKSHNTRYRLERWETPDGGSVVGKVPQEIAGSHFGPILRSYILQQYYHAHVTQPLIIEELREFAIDLSEGQISRILTENKESFHTEKKEILLAGLGVSSYINVDDTSARHKGKNGYCTHIGNENFAWFESTDSKSRINFLKLLSAGSIGYLINTDALGYMIQEGLPKEQLVKLSELLLTGFNSDEGWEKCLKGLGMTGERHIRIATEGALYANVIENGFNTNMVILSDDAGQFNIFFHALCWVHAERTINKLVGFSDDQRLALEQKRSQIWDYYAELKEYKAVPDEHKKAKLQSRFDEIFTDNTCFASLNLALKRIMKNKSELLLVLERPEIPLHNNMSENDIREYVKKRKISGSTRSDSGRRCRDTFTSLKKTCRKLGVSFWEFLKDRLTGKKEILFLPDLINLKARQSGA